MFVKLSFSSYVRATVPLRILADIINTSSITSVSALQSRFTSASYSTTLTSSFDATKSTIIRTDSPTNTTAHVSYWDRPSYGDIEFTLQQPVYDSPSNYTYTQLRTTITSTNTSSLYFQVGSAITGGTITATNAALSVSETSTNVAGTLLTLGGNNLGQLATLISGTNFTQVYTFWAYITDTCFFFAFNNSSGSATGWPGTYSSSTFSGPYFQTQYTRYDYHNTMSNGIYPVLYTNPRGTSIGYGKNTDFSAQTNILYASDYSTIPLRVHSMISAMPSATPSFPLLYNYYVNVSLAGRTNFTNGASVIQTAGSASTAAAYTGAGTVSSVSSTRFPTADLTGTGFGLLPIGWEAHYYGNFGGNATDKCGCYIYNGDYAPGDTFVYNNAIYMIWPIYYGPTLRIGIAVPQV